MNENTLLKKGHVLNILELYFIIEGAVAKKKRLEDEAAKKRSRGNALKSAQNINELKTRLSTLLFNLERKRKRYYALEAKERLKKKLLELEEMAKQKPKTILSEIASIMPIGRVGFFPLEITKLYNAKFRKRLDRANTHRLLDLMAGIGLLRKGLEFDTVFERMLLRDNPQWSGEFERERKKSRHRDYKGYYLTEKGLQVLGKSLELEQMIG